MLLTKDELSMEVYSSTEQHIRDLLETANWALIPNHMHESVEAYILTGRPVGDFLKNVLAHDIWEAAISADDKNAACLHGWIVFLANYVPIGCHGSQEHVKNWVNVGGARQYSEDVA